MIKSTLFIGLLCSVILSIVGCTAQHGVTGTDYGYGIGCDQTGHMSIILMYSDGRVSHQSDPFTPQSQSCQIMSDGSVIIKDALQKPIKQ